MTMTLKPPSRFQDPAPTQLLSDLSVFKLFDESGRSLAVWQGPLPGLHFPSSGRVQHLVLLRGASKAWLHTAASDDDLASHSASMKPDWHHGITAS